MQPQEILKEAHNSGLTDTGFWYIYSLAVTSLLASLILIIIFLSRGALRKFQSDIKKTHDQFAESITILTKTSNDMMLMVKLHDNEIQHLKDDVRELKDKPKRR